MEQKYIDLLKGLNHNKHYLNRYINFVQVCIYTKDDYTEKHHFLPSSLFPEYEKDKKNLIVLTGRQHFIAHYMLAKAVGGKMWFAFNQMRRVGGRSILYEYARIYISEQISKANTGRPKTVKEIKDASIRMMNTLVVKDAEGNKYRLSKDDPRYISGELVSYRVGYKHTSETKQKIKDNNGIKGKTICHHKDTNHIIYIKKSDILPKDYIMGPPTSISINMKKRMNNSFWVTLKDTGKYKRVQKEDFNEQIHTRGRVGFKGFKHINEQRRFGNIK